MTNVHAFPKNPEPSNEAAPPKYSDESLAQQFAHEHAERLRYVAAWGCWVMFNGKQWHKGRNP